ncbi:MAG TPA: hypothetical protein VFK93_00635 [Candidatus Limnocylindria bacterium]|nr:hypothetical protein [Candidatus Limnocylindria bacterium]
MTASKRPSTSSLRRFITTRPYVTIAELRRRFFLDCDGVTRIERGGSMAYVGLPDREALKLQDLWQRDEIGLELSVEVRAPVVVGIYPMRIARFVQEQVGNPHAAAPVGAQGPTPMPHGATRENGQNGHGWQNLQNGQNGQNGDANAPTRFERRGNGGLNDFAGPRPDSGRAADSHGSGAPRSS